MKYSNILILNFQTNNLGTCWDIFESLFLMFVCTMSKSGTSLDMINFCQYCGHGVYKLLDTGFYITIMHIC